MSAPNLTTVELTDAAATLQKVAELGQGWHPDHPHAGKAVELGLIMQLTCTYLLDLAKGLAEGMSVADASAVMISGDRAISDAGQQAMADAKRLSLS